MKTVDLWTLVERTSLLCKQKQRYRPSLYSRELTYYPLFKALLKMIFQIPWWDAIGSLAGSSSVSDILSWSPMGMSSFKLERRCKSWTFLKSMIQHTAYIHIKKGRRVVGLDIQIRRTEFWLLVHVTWVTTQNGLFDISLMEDPPQCALGAPDSQNFVRASVSKRRTIMFSEHGLGIL